MMPGYRRLLIIIVILLLVWQLIRYFPLVIDFKDEEMLRPLGAPVLVTVFYEALCPDSKNFIIKQLQSTYYKAPNLIEINFVPYGKATTIPQPDGSFKFDCQHGSVECVANMYHSCALEAIEDIKLRLDVITCMIKDNRAPKEAMQRCTREHRIDEIIQRCYDSQHGAELLNSYGEQTHALKPTMTFVPTITLDGSQGRQASILKDLLGEVCKVVGGRGPVPDVCK